MQYRKLDAKGDMSFGHGGASYLKNSPLCVGQAVVTRLRLLREEWFLDLTEGTPYSPLVLGKHTKASYDMAIRERVLNTEGVVNIESYESIFEPESRNLTIMLTVNTIYGPAKIQEIL